MTDGPEPTTVEEALAASKQRIAEITKSPAPAATSTPVETPRPVDVGRAESPVVTEESAPAKTDEAPATPAAAPAVVAPPDLSALPAKFHDRAKTIDPELLNWIVKDGVEIKSTLTRRTQELSEQTKKAEESAKASAEKAGNWDALMADAEARARLTELHQSRNASPAAAPVNWAELAVTDPEAFNTKMAEQLAQAKQLGQQSAERVVEERIFAPRDRASAITSTLETWANEHGVPETDMANAILMAKEHGEKTGMTVDKWQPGNVVDLLQPYISLAKTMAGANGAPAKVPTVVSPSRSSGGIAPPVVPAHERNGTPFSKMTAEQKAESAARWIREKSGVNVTQAELQEVLRRG